MGLKGCIALDIWVAFGISDTGREIPVIQDGIYIIYIAKSGHRRIKRRDLIKT